MDAQLENHECRLLAEFFTLFGNGTRLQIFCALQAGRKTVSELAEHAGVSLQNVSQHLRLMRAKGAVTTEKEGQHVYYTIVDPRLTQGASLIRDALVDAMRRRASHVVGQESRVGSPEPRLQSPELRAQSAEPSQMLGKVL